MAKLDGEELKKFNKLLDELNRKKDKLGQDKILDLDGTVENLGVVNELLDTANGNLNDLQSSVEGIRESWGSIVGELKKVDNLTGVSVKSFNKLSGIADKLSMSQKGLNELSSRQIGSLITKTKIEEQNLIFQKKQLEAKGRDKASSDSLIESANQLIEAKKYELALLQKSEKDYKNIKKELNDQIKEQEKKIKIINEEASALVEIQGALKENDGLIQQQIDTLKTQEKQTRNVERATGLTGAAMKGISGFLDKIGMSNMGEVFEDANLAAKSTAERLTDGGKKAGGLITKIKTMGSAFKVVGKAIIRNLTDPLVLAGMLIKGFKSAFNFFANAYKKGEEAAMRISDENVNMARSLGISQKAASKLAGSVAGMGPTTAASKSSIEGIYKAMGSTEKLSGNTLKVFVKLNTMAGMSAESLAKFQKFAKKSGEDAGTLVSEMAKTAGAAIKNNKLAMTQRDLLDETANQSAYVKLQFAGQGPALVKAVAQSKALGLNMKQARDMASSLLNFEDSIAKEMEAELLIGRDLNLEEARALALKGDNVGAAKAIAEQVGSAADFMNLNVIAQQALAEAAGMGVDEMANMLSGQQDMKAEGDDLVKNQEDGIKAMTSAVSLREAAENRARAAAEASIPVYNKLSGIVHRLQDTFTEIQKIVNQFLGENILEPMTKFLESKEGKEFLKKLPEYVKNALDKMKELVTTISTFLSDTDSKYPWLKKLLAGAAGGAMLLKVTGLDKSLIEGIKKIPGLFSSKVSTSQKLAKAAGVELGEPSNPMFVKVDGSGMDDITDNLTDNMDSIWKGRNVKWMSRFKKFSNLFGGKNSMVGRSMRNLAAMFGKRSSIFKQVFKNLGNKFKNIKMPNLTRIFSKMKMPNLTSIFSKIKIPTGAAGGLLKTIGGKILAPLEIAMGAITGVSQVAGKTKEEKKAAGIREDMGNVEAGVLGALTGNANKGSSLSKYVGIEEGGAGDEALGIAASGARGAMVGAAIGSVIPVVGTAVGAAVGGIVGTVSEGFKVFSDPNSKLRQGIVNFATNAGEKISGWASSAGETISGWASSAGETMSGWASSAGEKISGWASSAGEKISGWSSSVGNVVGDFFSKQKERYVNAFSFIGTAVSNLGTKIKNKFISIKDNIVNTISSIPQKITAKIKKIGGKIAEFLGFAKGGIAPGGFQAFADGGIVTKPTLGLVGEGSMNEAIIPLPDGKSVPVKIEGGSSNNSSNAQVITLLKELITVVKSGGDVILDGQKVGTAMAAGSYRMQ